MLSRKLCRAGKTTRVIARKGVVLHPRHARLGAALFVGLAEVKTPAE